MSQTIGFNNTKSYTSVLTDGSAGSPFSGYTLSDSLIGVDETVTVTLAALPYYSATDLGTLTDPLGGGSWDPTTHTFTETGLSTGTPTAATQILDRLVYTAPTLSSGQGETVLATVSVAGQTNPAGAQRLEVVTRPAIANTVATQPVGSGATIKPFATTSVSDGNFNFNTTLQATITLTDGGAATDADGLLTGAGLSKTGVGTYTLSSPYGYLYNLQPLVFTPTAVSDGATRTTNFQLSVADTAAGLSSTDTTTSVEVFGLSPTPTPLITGTWDNQTVAANATINPLSGVTVSDTNPAVTDTATLTVSGGGTLSGAGLTNNNSGTYTVAAGTPQSVTATLNALAFTPPALTTGQTTNTINIRLDVSDGTNTATDNKTAITEVALTPPPPPSPNNTILLAGATGAIVDGAGNLWTIDSAGKVAINGVEDVATANVAELAYVNGTIWQETTGQVWLGETAPNDSWAPGAGTLSSPLAAGTPTPTATPAPTPTPTVAPTATRHFTVSDQTLQSNISSDGSAYTGPVSGVGWQYIQVTPDNLNITATIPSVFVHSGSGNDAIAVNSGINVLDGGTGSNFLTGGSGTDTFFVDDRGPSADIWSTVNNFHAGDAATLWGVSAGSFTLNWADGQGASGFTGLTLHATAFNKPTASLTLVGFTENDLTDGRLSFSFGTDPSSGSAYIYVHANA